MTPYGIISDTHHHAWSAFSTTLESGVNSRLNMLLNETQRCASEVRKAGGDTIIHAGDLFHVRGSIAPSVLNPTKDCYRVLIRDGFKIVIDAGNHDLESKESTRLGSAITSLEDIGCKVINSAKDGLDALPRVVMIPWTQKIEDLRGLIVDARDSDPTPREIDLVIHAPLDGVIIGIPDHGLDPAWLGSLGFRHVFAGHYHHHKDFGNGVYSIGALAHHTWSDVNSKAGFLIVSDDGVKHFASHAPEFIEIDASIDPDDIPLIVDGNFVRAKISSSKQKDVEELRAYLNDCGAAGVVILPQKEASVSARTGSTVSAGASLEASVGDFIKVKSYANPERLALLCQDILSEVRSAA
jgi:DNA repair exonuclease SbcCD nuclease subunit